MKIKIQGYEIFFERINKNECIMIIPELAYYAYLNIENLKIDELKKELNHLISELIKNRDIKKLKKRDLKAVQIKITNACNLSCIYCFERVNKRNIKFISMEDLKIIINNLKKYNIKRIVITGGEPTLHPKFIEIINMLRSKFPSIEIRIQTNGTNPQIIKKLKKDPKISIQVSLDHYKKEIHEKLRGKNTYEKVIKTIEVSKEKGFYLIVYSTLTKMNIVDFNKFVEFLSNKNVDLFGFTILRLQGKAKNKKELQLNTDEAFEFYKKVFELRKKYDFIASLDDYLDTCLGFCFKDGCGAGKYTVSIDWNLNVFPCQICTDERLLMGSLKKNSLLEIISEKNNIYNMFSKYEVNKSDCKECYFKYFCGGGCMVEKFRVYENLEKPCVLCKLHKKVFKYLIHEKNILEFCDNYVQKKFM